MRPEILRVDRQVRHLPQLVVALGQRLEALLDRVLVRARKRGVDELAGIGVARMDRQLVAVLDGTDDLVDVGDDEPRIDPLAEQVQRQGHDIDIAGALAIAEERALDPLRTGHDRQLGGGDRRARGRCADAR